MPESCFRQRRPGAAATLARLALPALLTLAAGCSPLALQRAAHTATGFTSHVLCDEVFISGLPLDRAFDERIRPLPGQAAVVWALQPRLDLAGRSVQVSLAGSFSRIARFNDRDGCQVVATDGDGAADADAVPPVDRTPPPPPDPFGPDLQPGATARLQAALASALPVPADVHRTRAVVVLQDGRLVGERYAAGIGPDTPLLGFSASKSVTNALVGILVQQGRLQRDQPGLLPAWRQPGDARQAITVAHLLRHTAGLDLRQDNSGFDASTQIMFGSRDKAAAAAAAPLAHPPGRHWAYADTNYLLLSRLVRDAVGGDAASVRQFMQDGLFGPVGMRRARMDLDATGTGMGAAQVMATARDWARFGQLFLDDGVVGGRRLLPPGWVAWSTMPTVTPNGATGYGAGWWTNRQAGHVPGWGAPWGLPSAPADAFFARSFMGQFVVVVPSHRLVVVRLSSSHVPGDDIAETDRIVAAVLAATADGGAGRHRPSRVGGDAIVLPQAGLRRDVWARVSDRPGPARAQRRARPARPSSTVRAAPAAAAISIALTGSSRT